MYASALCTLTVTLPHLDDNGFVMIMMNGFHPHEFEHPQLGPIVGRGRNEHVVQFRSIPYARPPARFRQARLIDELPPKQRTYTEYTYACPQHEQSMEPFGGPVPGQEKRRYDEFSCLNLTITAPAALLEPGCTKKVPVMVYVHGGGFTVGAHYGGPHGNATPPSPVPRSISTLPLHRYDKNGNASMRGIEADHNR